MTDHAELVKRDAPHSPKLVAALKEMARSIALRPAEFRGPFIRIHSSRPRKGRVMTDTTNVVAEIHAERLRQISKEGWSVAHDDKHDAGELAYAAACYAFGDPSGWPWDFRWWKPSDRRRDLIKAGALIVAEIERLDRIPSPQKGTAND